MKPQLITLAAAVAACALAGSTSALAGPMAGHPNLIIDGDFSSPNTGGSVFHPANGAVGWTNESEGTIEVGSSPIYGLPCISNGCQNLEVNDSVLGDVVQTVSGLKAGETYDVSFDYGGRNVGGPQAMDFLINGVQFGSTLTSDGVHSFWTPLGFRFTAPTSGLATVEFLSLNAGGNPCCGNEITNVALSVPEPATWAMMLVGFGGLGVAMRSRRKPTPVTA